MVLDSTIVESENYFIIFFLYYVNITELYYTMDITLLTSTGKKAVLLLWSNFQKMLSD